MFSFFLLVSVTKPHRTAHILFTDGTSFPMNPRYVVTLMLEIFLLFNSSSFNLVKQSKAAAGGITCFQNGLSCEYNDMEETIMIQHRIIIGRLAVYQD